MIKRIINYLRRKKYEKAISVASVEQRFSNIYESNIWYANKESRSGSGSTLRATKGIREELPKILEDLNCTGLIDIGCGDFNWMKEVNLPCEYLGVDIVKEVIESNKREFSYLKGVSFQYLNAIDQPIPPRFDTALCREVLFHLSFEDGQKVIDNVKNGGIHYFIATTTESAENNKDIKTGEFRNVNLCRHPYNLPQPLLLIPDNYISEDRYLGVFDLRTPSIRTLEI